MKAEIYHRIELITTIKADFSDRSIPSGTTGTIIECYEQPEEGYSIDLGIPSTRSVTGFEYENVVLRPEQFVVLEQKELISRVQEIENGTASGKPASQVFAELRDKYS